MIGIGIGIGRQRGTGSGGVATVPATITAGQWTLADSPSAGGDTLTVNLISAPSNGGSAIIRYEFRRNGGSWSTLPGGTSLGARNITVLATTLANIELRAVNAIGNALASDTKSFTPSVLAGTTTETLSFDGVSLTASGVVSYGTYADGSYWINGGGNPVSVTLITPTSTTADRSIASGGTTGLVRVHGAMVDPGNADRYIATDVSTLTLRQEKNYGFSSGMVGQGYDEWDATSNHDFDATLNVDPGYVGGPLVLTQGTIVKAISKLSGVSSTARPAVDKLVPFTIVTTAPAANSLRPATALASKVANWTTADLNMARLPNLTPTGVTIPTYATVLAKLRYQSWQHTYNVLSRNIVGNTGDAPVYGGDFYEYTEAMLGLCYSTWTAPQKLTVATLLVQFAIDIAGRAVEGGIWQDNGGHCTARKSLLAFAAYLMDDDATLSPIIEYKALGTNYTPKPTPIGRSIFGDDTQHLTITQPIIDQARAVPYTQNQLGWPEWGGDATRDPTSELENHLDGDQSLDTSNNKVYRHIQPRVNAPAALALRLMGAKNLFNNQVFFDYQDRHMSKRIAAGAELPGSGGNDISPWVIDAWDLSRGVDDLWAPTLTIATVEVAQSQKAYGWIPTDVYNAIPRPTIRGGNMTVHFVTETGAAPTSVVVTNAALQAKQISIPVAAASQALGYILPNVYWHRGAHVVPGTGRYEEMDPADTDRLTADMLAVVAAVRASSDKDIDAYIDDWMGNDSAAAKTMHESFAPFYYKQTHTGGAFTLGNTNPAATNTTAVVGACRWDAAAAAGDLGQGMFRKNATAIHFLGWPNHGTSPTNGLEGLNFTTDSTGATGTSQVGRANQHGRPSRANYRALYDQGVGLGISGYWGPGCHSSFMESPAGTHPLGSDVEGPVDIMWSTFPSVLREAGLNVTLPTFGTPTISGDRLTITVPVNMPSGATLTTKAILRGQSFPGSPSPHQQEVTGFELRLPGETYAQRRPIFRTDSGGGYPGTHKGTVTIFGGAIRIVMQTAIPAGEFQLYYLEGDVNAMTLDPAGTPRDSGNRLYRHFPLAHIPAWYEASFAYPFPGLDFDTQVELTVGAAAPVWSVSGGDNQITITTAPTVAAPVASGGTNSITVTG